MRKSFDSEDTSSHGRGHTFRLNLSEVNGSLADLGTLLPLAFAVITVCNLPASGVLISFGAFYLATGLYYRLPIPVQPMKAIAAIAIAGGASAAEIAASGMIVGLFLLVLGLTGWINRMARLVPQSILTGLQLGLGISLGMAGLKLAGTSPGAALATAALIVVLLRFTRWPAAIAGFAFAGLLAIAADLPVITLAVSSDFAIPSLVIPTVPEIASATTGLALPQLALTLTNAIVLTALIARDYFGHDARHVTPSRQSITSGLANLLTTPFGAFPMCHGAGGLTAHFRFGARTGLAPALIGLALVTVAIVPILMQQDLLLSLPLAALGALLLVSSWELAISRRLRDAKPSCWPVIAATAGVTVVFSPLVGLLAGTASELVRLVILRIVKPDPESR